MEHQRPGGDLAIGRQIIANTAMLALAVLLAACSIDDSGPVRSVWRPPSGKPSYINVVYLTDREPDPKAAGGFSTRWADAPSCGTAEAIVPAALLPDEKPKYGYVAVTKPAACSTGGLPYSGVIAMIEAQAKERHCNSVFLFVHGFHTGFDGAVLRAAQVSHDAQTGCAVAAFSWSAEIDIDRYVADLEHSGYARPFLSELLRELSETDLHVTVLAHSMGTRLLLATLSGFRHSRYPVRPGFIDELVLAAADVGALPSNDDFTKLMRDAANYARRTTVYVSTNDSVLEISKREHGGIPRAGAEPPAELSADGGTHIVDIIDASDSPADILDHSYFAMSRETIADMTLALRGVPTRDRLRPEDGWPPTLVCGKDKDGPCAGDRRYALALPEGRHPRLITRIIVTLVPLVPIVR